MWNDGASGTRADTHFLAALKEILPDGRPVWEDGGGGSGLDGRVDWMIPGGRVVLDLEIKRQSVLSRDEVRRIVSRAPSGSPALLASYISPAARDELRRTGWSYWDGTGNLLIQNRDPLVWIERLGATRNPSPDMDDGPRRLRSLKGHAASVVIVHLLTQRRAPSMRELSRRTAVGVATVSRVVDLLREEELLEGASGGSIVVSDVLRLAERWSMDYSFKSRRYFLLLGERVALERLRSGEVPYALTGIQAANQYLGTRSMAASLPSNETWIHVSDREAAERMLQLVPDPRGSILVSECGFLNQEECRVVGGERYVWPWRTVGDLLSTRGRGASVGRDLAEALGKEWS